MRRRLSLFLLLLCLGCGTAPPGSTASPSPATAASASRPAASPLPSPSASPAPAVDRAAVEAAVVRSAREFPGRAAIAWRLLDGGPQVTVGADEVFESASLVKLPVLVELYRRASTGELDLEEELEFTEEFRVGGSGRLKDQPAGTRWRLAELARLMIVESDNGATDMLLHRLGASSIEKSMASLGLEDTAVRRRIFDFAAIDQGRDNLTSAADTARLLAGIGTGELPGSEAMRKVLLGQQRRDMIPAGLPPGTPVAHKTGELTGVLHDAGIVSGPRGEYVLVLLGQDFADRDEAVRAWASASRRIWEAQADPSDGPATLPSGKP